MEVGSCVTWCHVSTVETEKWGRKHNPSPRNSNRVQSRGVKGEKVHLQAAHMGLQPAST